MLMLDSFKNSCKKKKLLLNNPKKSLFEKNKKFIKQTNGKNKSGKINFFLLFPITKELHHMHKAMGGVIPHHGINNTTNL